MRKLNLLSVVAMVAVLCLSTAQAAAPALTVHFKDLHLDRASDVQRLYARIAGAADNVCPYFGARAIHQAEIFAACRATTIADAVARVNDKRLTAFAATR